MKIVPIKELPRRVRVHRETRVEDKPLKEYLNAFLKVGVKYARVDIAFDEYADEWSAYGSFRQAVKQQKLPIDVRFRDRVIYLINRDLEV